MLEVEIKARISDGVGIINALVREGFMHEREVIETDVYYNSVSRDFAKTDEALRIREIDDGGALEYKIAYKGKKQGGVAKIREEHETSVGDQSAARGILEALGYFPAHTVRKRRCYYKRGDITACIDDVEGLGLFVELEQMNGSGEELMALKQTLQIGECIQSSYLNLLLSSKETID